MYVGKTTLFVVFHYKKPICLDVSGPIKDWLDPKNRIAIFKDMARHCTQFIRALTILNLINDL